MHSPDQIPTEKDWEGYETDLDQSYAHGVFFEKTIEEVIPDFERSILSRVEDLHFMPTIPFRYYMLAYRNYVLSPRLFSVGYGFDAPDAASCFLTLIIAKLEEAPGDIAPIMEELLPAIEHVASNQKQYDADEDIYGSFPEKFIKIRELYNHV